MKLTLLLGCATVATALFPLRKPKETQPDKNSDVDLSSEWLMYKGYFQKSYSEEEEDSRRTIYLNTRSYIDDHNQLFREGNVSFKTGINQFSDMTLEEANNATNGFEADSEADVKTKTDIEIDFDNGDAGGNTIPESADWRHIEDARLIVKDQGICGSCWAFSATGALEAQIALHTGKSVDLSEQELVDCSRVQENKGCSGGQMTKAFNYVKEKKGLSTTTHYPYKGSENRCPNSFNNCEMFQISEIVRLDDVKEEDVMKALANHGPICAGMDASQPKLFAYTGGVFYDEACKTKVNHGVLLVGYGTQDEKNFWIIKNSWGEKWGEGGYMLLHRGDNHCGILNMLSYPKLSFNITDL